MFNIFVNTNRKKEKAKFKFKYLNIYPKFYHILRKQRNFREFRFKNSTKAFSVSAATVADYAVIKHNERALFKKLISSPSFNITKLFLFRVEK